MKTRKSYQDKKTNQPMIRISESTVRINGVEFRREQLLQCFPKSYFQTLLTGPFSEARQADFKISILAGDQQDNQRYMRIIAQRLKTGVWPVPGITRAAAGAQPKTDGDRFKTYREMEDFFDFLELDKKELDLIENEVAETEDDPEDDVPDQDDDFTVYDGWQPEEEEADEEDYYSLMMPPDNYDEDTMTYRR